MSTPTAAPPLLDNWLSFLTEPLPASDSATAEALRESTASAITHDLTSAARHGLLDERVMLAQFVQVIPKHRQLEFDVPAILAVSRVKPLLRAISHQLTYIKKTGISIFSRLLLRERDDETGDVLVMSPIPTGLCDGPASDRFVIRCLRTPMPEPLLEKLSPIDDTDVHVTPIDRAYCHVACHDMHRLIRSDVCGLPDLADETRAEAPHELIALLGDASAASHYLANVAPLALDRHGHIVFIVPRVHRGGKGITENLGGGGCLFIVNGTMDHDLVGRLYALTFRLSAAVVGLCSVARAMDQMLIYEQALQVFAHDGGRHFQESEVLSLMNHREARVRLAARRLSVALGLAESTRVLKDEKRALPRSWLHDDERSPSPETLVEALHDVCSFFLFARATLPSRWSVEWRLPGAPPRLETMAAGLRRELRSVDHDRLGDHHLPRLPGLRDHRATTALTFGLAELIRNARKGLGDNQSTFKKAYRRRVLRGPALSIEIVIDESKGTATVHLESPYLAGTEPWSRTIVTIQNFERACLGRGDRLIVNSEQFARIKTHRDGVEKIRATWTYDYGYVASLAKEEAEAQDD